MNKLLSCRFNMDTNRVEARFADGSTLAIDCIAIEDEYTLVNDHYLPNLTAASPVEHPIGRWGRLHKNFLKEYHPIRYNQLVLSGELGSYLAKLDEQAEEQFALIVQQMQEAEDVTEALKAANQMEWVQRMNNIRNRAEEIIKAELIFV